MSNAMKRTGLYIAALLMTLAGTVAVNAQETTLTKEITVETEFVPVEQKVSKLNVLPEARKTAVSQKSLSYSDWNEVVDFPHEIDKFEPYGYKTKYPFSKARGYVDAGIGLQLDVVGSAGYRFIENSRQTLGAWLQHTSSWNGKNTSALAGENPLKKKFNDNVVGVDYTHRFDSGILSASAFYHYDRFNYFGANDQLLVATPLENQTINEFGIVAQWTKPVIVKKDEPQFTAQLKFNHFGYSDNIVEDLKGLKENHVQLKVGSEGIFGSFSLGIKATADYLLYSNCSVEDKSEWIGQLKATPYIRYSLGNLSLKGGLNVDLSAHDGSTVRLSPDVNIDYKIRDGIAVYANAGGGKTLNTLSGVHAECSYIAPNQVLGSSYSPVNGELGIRIGSFAGFYAKPFFAYGVFKDALLPYAQRLIINNEEINAVAPYVYMQKYEISGWKAGVQLGYNYNGIVDAKASFQYSPQDQKKGYRTGFDRAEMVADVQVKVTPIKPLAITLGYELRANRCYYNCYGSIGTPPIESWGKEELDNVNRLSLDASYQINKTVGVFVNANNLLNQKWDEFVGMGVQQINALAGVNIMF